LIESPKKRRILGFGTAALDFRIQTAEMGLNYRDKLLAQNVDVFGGGAIANCLTQVARLGGKAYWLGKLGNDWIGDRIIMQLEQEGIDCSFVIRDGSFCSPFNVAIYAGEQKRRVGGFLLPNSLAELSNRDIEMLISNIESGDWMICEIGEIPLETTLMVCQTAKDRSINLVIDIDLDPILQCGGDRELILKILRFADLIVPNQVAVKSLYPGLTPKMLAERMALEIGTTTVVTAGADGVYCCEPNERCLHIEALEVDVVDSVGAGDAFHGGFLFGLSVNWSLEEAIQLGIRCASLNCMSFGARSGMPKAEDLSFNA
jgi:sugar/nucleoside kinase (ribokinase family)